MTTLKRVGKYEIAEQIGVGGFGVVYKAWDPYIQRWVALKVCSASEEEATQRFFREAQLAGALQHPNITLIYDFGIEEGTPFFVQEFLSGEDLDDILERTRPTLEASLGILQQVCTGLEFAHSRGIIHRDIKPANIRVLEDGTVKIMDFGIAKSLQAESRLTQTGVALGTAGYLAPEQLAGKPIDARTDLFSLGVMAYELITGLRPFTGPNLSNVIYQILHQPPNPPRKINPDCPERLEHAILKALAKDPGKRYSSVRAFGEDLRDIQASFSRRTPSGRVHTATGVVREELSQWIGAPRPDRTTVTQLAARPLDQLPATLETGTAPTKRGKWWLIAPAIVVAVTAAWSYLSWNGTIPSPVALLAASAPTAVPATPVPAVLAPTVVPTPSAVTVALDVDPPSDIIIDGRALGRVTSRNVQLGVGRHVIEQRIAGYRQETREVEVTPETDSLALHLPPFGQLSVVNDFGVPSQGATVYVDGERVGGLPLRDLKVEARRHTLKVTWPNGRRYEATVEVKAETTINRVVRPD
jgi:hypothetical protein